MPINTRFKASEAGYVLGKSGAKALFCVNGFLGNDYVAMLRQAGVDLPATTVVMRGDTAPGATLWADFIAVDGPRPRDQPTAADLSDVIFTSGTTGNPKGVMATHGQTMRTFDIAPDGNSLYFVQERR